MSEGIESREIDVRNEEEDDTDPIESSGASRVAPIQKAGFRKIVRRIQLAAEFNRLSKANRETDDCFQEDDQKRRKSKLTHRRISGQPSLDRGSCLSYSQGSNVSRHSKLFGDSSSSEKHFVEGEIKFPNDDSFNAQAKPFVSIKANILKTGIARVFKDSWQLDVPKIITYVITSNSQKCQWSNKKQIEHFQAGITKV